MRWNNEHFTKFGCRQSVDESALRQQARSRQAQWQSWLAPVSDAQPTGDDPGYDDDFQRIREEVNKISGVDTELICQLAENC